MQGSLSVVIPVYNEAAVIEDVVNSAYREIIKKHGNAELIVAEDGSTDGTKTAEIWDAKNFFPAQKLPDEKPVQVTKSVEQKVQKKAEPPQPTSQQSPNLPGWEEALFEMTISNLVRGMQLPYKGLVSGFELSRSAFRLILEPIAERVDRALGFNPKKEPAQTTKR